MRLAPLVTSVTYRHPAVLAKIAAAVDQVSHGRLTLGIGAGWQENEHAAYGIALGTVRERMDRFEEAMQILRSLLDQPRTTFSGQYFQLQDAPNQPAPVQARLPLLIGGGGERRTLRIAARYADHWNAWTTPELLAHKLSVLRAHCEQVGRDPARDPRLHPGGAVPVDRRGMAEGASGEGLPGRPVIVGTPAEVADIVARYQEAGADELIVPDFTLGSTGPQEGHLRPVHGEVAPAFR